MRRHMRAILTAGMLVLASLGTGPAFAQTMSCQFAGVFLMLRDQIGRDRVGECAGPTIRNESGDVNQPTTRGIMTLRTADQVAAFSDGQTTWLVGPNGLESRPSGSRLPWETGSSPGSGSASVTAGLTGTPNPTNTPTPTPSTSTPTPMSYAPTATPYGVPQLNYTQSQSGQVQTTDGQPQTPYGQTQTPYGQSQPTSNSSLSPGDKYPSSQFQSQLPQSGNGSPTTSASPMTSASPTVVAQDALPITLDGDGASTSKPFSLTGGDYIVRWQVQLRSGKPGCYMGTRLRHVDDPNPGSLVMHTTLGSTKDRSVSSETRLFAVAPGRYVLDVATTGCAWKIALQAP